MKVHSDIIIFELLNLYFLGTDKSTIQISNLRTGFITLLEIIKEENNEKIELNFRNEFMNFLRKYSDYCTISEYSLEINDLEGLFNTIIDSYGRLTNLDYELQSIIFDDRIYQALEMKIPYEEVSEFFDLNKEMLREYLELGQNELENNQDKELMNKISTCLQQINEKINEADNRTLTKLKICIFHNNDIWLPHTKEDRTNSSWHIVLFSNDPKKIYSLSYAQIEYLTLMVDPETDEESEELLNSFFDEESEETIEELPFFLICVFMMLDRYLKENPNTRAKEALLIKKYLLMACPELTSISNHLLKNHNMESYILPPLKEEVNEDSFEVLKKVVIKCTTNLVKSNIELEKPHILGKVITSAIFIRVFLELSINEDSKQSIIDLITNGIFYKKPNYESVTKVVDNIIFNDSPNLFR